MSDIYGERYVWDSYHGKMTCTKCRVLVQSPGVNNKRYKFIDINDKSRIWNVIESRLGKASENYLSVYFLGEGHAEEAFAAFRLLYSMKMQSYLDASHKMQAELNSLETARRLERRKVG